MRLCMTTLAGRPSIQLSDGAIFLVFFCS